MLFVLVRDLVLNVTPGTWGAEWEESNKSLPFVTICWYYCISVAHFAVRIMIIVSILCALMDVVCNPQHDYDR